MKRIILVVLLLMSFALQAQSNSFIVSNNKLVWENVFISNETNIPALIGRHSRLKIISTADNIFKGKAEGMRNTCTGTSAFMKEDYSFDFEIEASEGKYRVTISNIVFKKKGKKAVGTTADSYFIKSGELQTTGTLDDDLSCFDAYFNRIFNAALYKNRS